MTGRIRILSLAIMFMLAPLFGFGSATLAAPLALECNSISVGNVTGGDLVLDGGTCTDSTTIDIDASVDNSYTDESVSYAAPVATYWQYDEYYHECNVYDQNWNWMSSYYGYC